MEEIKNEDSSRPVSARILGKEFDLNPQEMKALLKNEGFYDGEPGNYVPTEKAKPFHNERLYHNPNYCTETWDPSIKNVLNVNDDTKQKAKESLLLHRKKKSGEKALFFEQQKMIENEELDAKIPTSYKDKLIAVFKNRTFIGIIFAIILILITISLYPKIVHWWKTKVIPFFKRKKHSKSKEKDETSVLDY